MVAGVMVSFTSVIVIPKGDFWLLVTVWIEHTLLVETALFLACVIGQFPRQITFCVVNPLR
jgi:hypothetical protein